jgi:valyl-tRNA synthetase
MITVFPRADQQWVDPAAEAEMKLIQDVVTTSRMLRQTYNIPPAQSLEIELRITADAPRATLERYKDMVEGRAKVKATIGTGNDPVPGAAKAFVGADIQILMPLGGLIDPATEKGRIQKEIGKTDKEIGGLEKKLGNQDFLSRAPEEVVAEIRDRLKTEQQRMALLKDAIETLGVVK